MKALTQAVTYTLLAVIVAMSLSVTWAGGLFWWTLAACLIVSIGIVAWKSIQAGRELDAFLASEDARIEQSVLDYHCVGHGHYYRKTEGVWLCLTCGDMVRPIEAIEIPYNQGDVA